MEGKIALGALTAIVVGMGSCGYSGYIDKKIYREGPQERLVAMQYDASQRVAKAAANMGSHLHGDDLKGPHPDEAVREVRKAITLLLPHEAVQLDSIQMLKDFPHVVRLQSLEATLDTMKSRLFSSGRPDYAKVRSLLEEESRSIAYGSEQALQRLSPAQISRYSALRKRQEVAKTVGSVLTFGGLLLVQALGES